MVKGVSRQVIVVQSQDSSQFEQAIFILREGSTEVTGEMLLEQANRLIRENHSAKTYRPVWYKSMFLLAGAAMTGLIWLVSVLL